MFSPHQLKSFWDKVGIKGLDDCWEWTAARSLRGRPIYSPRLCKSLGISYLSYRVAWELTRGPIPEGLSVLHRCDNPLCCNPTHLFLGNQLSNTLDMLKKGRSGKAKLEERQVREIKVDERPRRIIAKEYGVTLNTVQKIKSGHSWRHLWISNQ